MLAHKPCLSVLLLRCIRIHVDAHRVSRESGLPFNGASPSAYCQSTGRWLHHLVPSLFIISSLVRSLSRIDALQSLSQEPRPPEKHPHEAPGARRAPPTKKPTPSSMAAARSAKVASLCGCYPTTAGRAACCNDAPTLAKLPAVAAWSTVGDSGCSPSGWRLAAPGMHAGRARHSTRASCFLKHPEHERISNRQPACENAGQESWAEMPPASHIAAIAACMKHFYPVPCAFV